VSNVWNERIEFKGALRSGRAGRPDSREDASVSVWGAACGLGGIQGNTPLALMLKRAQAALWPAPYRVPVKAPGGGGCLLSDGGLGGD
jgi:hypothetical protein